MLFEGHNLYMYLHIEGKTFFRSKKHLPDSKVLVYFCYAIHYGQYIRFFLKKRHSYLILEKIKKSLDLGRGWIFILIFYSSVLSEKVVRSSKIYSFHYR